ncbi:energy transducer TonB [Chitinimonas sp. BJYL2]|uniref:energy transducer TonB n=1 Tax=Chitinimonas sp. BJYL2 TaxID=2976696 RepID=UPI0022B5939A|nr:energy transducer TonB [Chitinimonas sp. BJYL2]
MWSAPAQPKRLPVLLVVGLLHLGLLQLALLRLQQDPVRREPVPLMTTLILPAPVPEPQAAPELQQPRQTTLALPRRDLVATPEIDIAPVTQVQLAVSTFSEPPAPSRIETPPTPPSPPAPIVPPRSDAAHLNNPPPSYPGLSRKLGEEGRVMLLVFIQPDGKVSEVRLKQSSGFERLDQAAMDAVKRWRYVPARQGDTAIAFWYAQPVDFALS